MKRRVMYGSEYIVKLLLGICFISPILIGVIFSLKPETQISSSIMNLLPTDITFRHYLWVLDNINIFRYLLNSLIVCTIVIVCEVLIASFAAYAFAFFKFKFKGFLFTAIIATMMIPGDVVIITNFVTIQSWDLTDTYWALVLPNLISGTAIFIMRQYYLTIPRELKDAATIDGSGDMTFLYKIAMPMSLPTIISLTFYLFIAIYNQYFWPLLVTNTDSYRTIQIGMAMLVSSERLEYGPMLAGATMAILPALTIFIIGQDYLVKGMTSGAIKG